jgi:DNA polymerase-3 subunit alpha
LLRLEKEILGMYVSSHPLRDIGAQVREEAEHLISELSNLPDGSTTTIVGMVANVKKVPTKSGGTMAFVTVEGLEGSVEMICFNKTYLENIGILQEDRLIKVRGRLERKDEAEQKFVPFTIEAFVPRTGFEPICILLDGERVALDTLDALKMIMSRFPGECPVELHVATGQGPHRLVCGDGYRVEPDTSLFAEIRVLLGEAGIVRLEPEALAG